MSAAAAADESDGRRSASDPGRLFLVVRIQATDYTVADSKIGSAISIMAIRFSSNLIGGF